jgi:integrase/recombinase XerD
MLNRVSSTRCGANKPMTLLAHQTLTHDARRETPRAVKRFLDYLFVECGLAGATVSAYQADLCAFWNDVAVDGECPATLSIEDVQRHLIALRDRGLATVSIARHLAAIKMFVRFQHVSGLLHRDVASLIELPKRPQYLPKTASYERIVKLLATPDPAEEFYLRDRALLELLYASGMRAQEVSDATLDRINLKVGYLRCIGKGNKERITPIGRDAIRAIDQYLSGLRPALDNQHSRKALFLSRTGRPLDRTNIWRLVRKYAEQAGFEEGFSPHSFRHCFATHMLAGGADLRVVQELLGHSSPTTTQVYLHVDPVHLKEVHRRCHPRQ